MVDLNRYLDLVCASSLLFENFPNHRGLIYRLNTVLFVVSVTLPLIQNVLALPHIFLHLFGSPSDHGIYYVHSGCTSLLLFCFLMVFLSTRFQSIQMQCLLSTLYFVI